MTASDKLLKWMLIPILPICGFYVLKKKNLEEDIQTDISRRKQWLLCAACSLAVGCYDGFYGPGTGTFLLILYTGVAKLPVSKASGTMKLANLSSNVMALAVFLFSGKIVILLGLAASAFSIAGHYVGSGMVMKNGSKIVRPIILVVLALLFIKINYWYVRKDFCIIKNGFINLDELVYETIFIIVFWDYDSESEESSKGEVVRVPKIASPECVLRPAISMKYHH